MVANISPHALGGYMKVGLVNFFHVPFFILPLPEVLDIKHNF